MAICFALILVLVFPNVYAQQSTVQSCGTTTFDCYQETGFRLTSNPVICMDLPSDRNVVAKLRAYTEDAILDWENKLNAVSASGPLGNIQLVPNGISDTCNIYIQYIAKPTIDQQGSMTDAVGITWYYSDHTAKIKIFYNTLAVDQYGSYYFLDSLAPDYQIQWTIKHELGHAFGLGHYIMTNEEQKNWLAGFAPTPSLMVTGVPPSFDVTGVVVTYRPAITQMDRTQLQLLYPNGIGVQTSQQPTASTPNIPTTEMTSSDISYWTPLTREYFANITNNLSSNDYGVHVLDLVDIFDSEHLVSIPDPVGNQPNISFWMHMPAWFTNDLSYWATSQISDNDLASAMQYLHNNGLFYFSRQ